MKVVEFLSFQLHCRGVSWDNAKERWLVTIGCLNERAHTYIGRYADEEKAALAYDAAAIALG